MAANAVPHDRRQPPQHHILIAVSDVGGKNIERRVGSHSYQNERARELLLHRRVSLGRTCMPAFIERLESSLLSGSPHQSRSLGCP